MCTGFTRDTHQYFMKASPARRGDFIEFFAEIDLLARALGMPRRRLQRQSLERRCARCYPLLVEVFGRPDASWRAGAPPVSQRLFADPRRRLIHPDTPAVSAAALPRLDGLDALDIGALELVQRHIARDGVLAAGIGEDRLPLRGLEAVAVLVEDRVADGPQRIAGEPAELGVR